MTILGLLASVLVVVLWWQLSPESPAAVRQTRRAPAPSAAGRTTASDATGVELVRLDALGGARAEPTGSRSDPFRFAAQAPPTPPQVASRAGEPGPGIPGGPGGPTPASGPPAPPPMMLKFIGILKPSAASTIAVLTDGKNVFYGREGETIEGRYRIERIGVESIEMAWADGRGRQVIRLSGS